LSAVVKAFLLLVIAGALVVIAGVVWIASRGISARAEPGRLETTVARTMRTLAIPRTYRTRPNPVTKSPEVVAEGMAHYADHCAVCHANDGSGDTEMGRGLYPKAPDMRLPPTQAMSDGELFYIIENGIRMTGMPAWSTGTAEGETSTWHLVHFIRELPRLTEEQLEQMKQRNPRSPEEIRQEIEEESFLKGGEVTPQPDAHGHSGAH
jgi:mono/diheme cytochrome c family protein